MGRTVFLVDTENIGSAWIPLLEKVKSTDKIILFYTDNTPFLSYPDLVKIKDLSDRYVMESCYTGANALDFQLVSYLGYSMKNSLKTTFCIVSNDNGYDAVIKFWKDRERVIFRMNAKDILSDLDEFFCQRDPEEKFNNKMIKIKEKCSDLPEEELQWLREMMLQNKEENLSAIHGELCKHFQQEMGRELYQRIKTVIHETKD